MFYHVKFFHGPILKQSKPRTFDLSCLCIFQPSVSLIFVVLSIVITLSGCQSTMSINGAGYQVTRFESAEAARLAALDKLAGPAIYSNNRQCEKDAACKK